MKKAFIFILVMLLVSATVFAATIDSGDYYYGSDDEKLDDYFGFSIGASLLYETYEAASGKVVDKALQAYGGLTEFAFFGDASFGVYVDGGILVNVEDSYNPEDVSKSPAYADATLGLAYRAKTDTRTSLLMYFGPEFTYFTNQYKYIDGYDLVYVDKTYMTMGATLGLETVYNIGGNWYLSAGAKASFLFLKWVTKEETTWHGSTAESEIDDNKGYLGFRVIPKISLYYKF